VTARNRSLSTTSIYRHPPAQPLLDKDRWAPCSPGTGRTGKRSFSVRGRPLDPYVASPAGGNSALRARPMRDRGGGVWCLVVRAGGGFGRFRGGFGGFRGGFASAGLRSAEIALVEFTFTPARMSSISLGRAVGFSGSGPEAVRISSISLGKAVRFSSGRATGFSDSGPGAVRISSISLGRTVRISSGSARGGASTMTVSTSRF
jgi:hypothetical protein